MTSNLDHDLTAELDGLGEQLQAAIARSIRPGSRWRRKAVIIPAATVLALGVGAGTAAAAGAFDPAQVAHSMISGSMIFLGSTATCTTTDNITFDCTLDRPPDGPDVPYSQGMTEPYAIDGKVAGGCRGLDALGLHWTCYAGQAAVEHGIIVASLLGQPDDGAGVG